MSLLSALQLGSSSLAAQQAGLAVTGNNISNASTPGYTRETLDLVPSDPTTLQSGVQIGTGVSTQTINRAVNDALNGALNNANSDQGAASSASSTLQSLESTFGTLNSNDLASQVQGFFNQASTVANNPTDTGQLAVMVQTGQSLAASIQTLRSQVVNVRNTTQLQIQSLATQANTLVQSIASLNGQISSIQGGGGGADTLMDQRDQAISQLSQIMNVQTVNQGNGMVNLLVGSVPIVTGATTRGIGTTTTTDPTGTMPQTNVVFADNGDQLDATSGQIAGLVSARDNNINGAIGTLDTLAYNLIGTVNSISSQGQGLVGFSSVTGTSPVLNTNAPLNAGQSTTGLAYTPVNGTFNINVTDATTGATTTQQIQVNLGGTGAQTTLSSLAASITSGPIVASVNSNGTLSISSNNPDDTFTFSNDTSGALAALGINTFFTGSNAANIGVNNVLVASPSLLATGRNNVPGSNDNAQALAQAYTAGNGGLGGLSLQSYYAQFSTNLASQSSAAKNNLTAQTAVQSALNAQQQSYSGVSLDEEAVNLTKYQQAYQGTAQYINVVNTLMTALLAMIQ